MASKKKDPCRLLSAQAVLNRIDAMKEEIPGVRRSEDIECLHRMRVASRRLRSALRVFEPVLGKRARKWRKDVRWITGTLGRARDLDVQIEFVRAFSSEIDEPELRLGPLVLHDYLSQERCDFHHVLLGALFDLESAGLLEKIRTTLRETLDVAEPGQLEEARPLEQPWVREGIRDSIKGLLAYRKYVAKPECVEELHEMRIAAKRLRYYLEEFVEYHEEEIGEAVRTTKKVQDLLGSIHDCDVWTEVLPGYLKKGALAEARRDVTDDTDSLRPGLQLLGENRKRERKRLYRKFVKLWTSLEGDGYWKKLRKKLRS
jgi:CHAD domain-containing protein